MESKIFVSYQFKTIFDTGFGRIIITIDDYICNSDFIKKATEIIKEENGFKQVVILYWKLLED